MSATDELAELVNNITNARWRTIQGRLDASFNEITNDPILQLVVAANEKHRKETGQDDFDQFNQMTPAQISEYLGLTDGESS